MAEIIISFNEDGTSTVETKGFKGKSCKDASSFIEKALGKVVNDKKTAEYYQNENNSNVVRR